LTFLIKKTMTLLVMPLFAGLALVWTGILLGQTRWFKRRAVLVAVAGASVVTMLSLQPVANEVIKPLEMCYPPLVEFEGLRGVNGISNPPISFLWRPRSAKSKPPGTNTWGCSGPR
jgi:hypothetical protein